MAGSTLGFGVEVNQIDQLQNEVAALKEVIKDRDAEVLNLYRHLYQRGRL